MRYCFSPDRLNAPCYLHQSWTNIIKYSTLNNLRVISNAHFLMLNGLKRLILFSFNRFNYSNHSLHLLSVLSLILNATGSIKYRIKWNSSNCTTSSNCRFNSRNCHILRSLSCSKLNLFINFFLFVTPSKLLVKTVHPLLGSNLELLWVLLLWHYWRNREKNK